MRHAAIVQNSYDYLNLGSKSRGGLLPEELLRWGCGLMVSVLNSRSRGLGKNPWQGYFIAFLGKTLYSHSASGV